MSFELTKKNLTRQSFWLFRQNYNGVKMKLTTSSVVMNKNWSNKANRIYE